MSSFFVLHPLMTGAACISRARDILGQEVTALAWQGYHSYTVESVDGKSIVQFRSSQSPLDERVIELARYIHGSLVPAATQVASQPSETFCIWKMEKLPGVGFLHIISDEHISRKIVNTVTDMAAFFAAAWRHPQHPTVKARLAFSRQCSEKLDLLSAELPESLRHHANEVACKLPDITSILPWVLTHGDLSSMNILVDSSDGHLRGVVDWAEASIQPFGLALWGLEDILGYSDAEGWHWLSEDQGTGSRRLFSRYFFRVTGLAQPEILGAIESARKLGLLLRYGFECDGPAAKVTTDETFLGQLLNRIAVHGSDDEARH